MLKEVYNGSISYMQVMDESGAIDASLMPKELTDDKILDMYRKMSFARALDAKTLSLQRQGRAVTYAPLIGEEAVQVGSASAMRQNDIFVPNFRQHAVYLVRGLPLEDFFVYWRGFEEGNAVPKSVNGLPVAVPVSTQLPHSVGMAYAQKYRKTGSATIAYVGDGGTSEGDFYESINFAGVFKLPLVIIIENNQWAISVPRSKQSAAQTLAQKGIAAGIKCMQVDGNDVIAMYKATSDAISDTATGPTLIEAVTYRMSMHTTADDPTKYRPDADVEAWKAKDPIARVRKYLEGKRLWNDSMEGKMQDEQLKLIDEAVEKAEQFKPDPRSMFENVYSFMPDVLKGEEDEAISAGFWQG
ncbi:MAG: pyruvate dehydrogenase (acetyl-transferring) E1 component subunit alpha [Candidatus Marsarchaeota archaeon]|nr:pyruvate dehydrogenase (acetyl-transferring) E1 component subunit alpha [Candidatus Marsarchaeota archaeon]